MLLFTGKKASDHRKIGIRSFLTEDKYFTWFRSARSRVKRFQQGQSVFLTGLCYR